MARCPECKNAASKVRRATLESLLRPARRADIGEGPYHVCATPGCETVFFSKRACSTFVKSDLAVRFGLKEQESPRPVCYCFGHTVEDVQDEIRRTGRSTVLDRIKADMKQRGCRCEQTNPLGACCLKSIQQVVAEALRQTDQGRQADALTGNQDGDRAGTLVAAGSVLAAALSSACCWLPLVLIAFGVSAVGVAGFLESYRPYLIAAAAGLLGFAFYKVYFRRSSCEPGSACATPRRKLRRFNRAMLWTAAAVVSAFAFFPNTVGYVFGTATLQGAGAEDAGLASAAFHIDGMACEGCANTLQTALLKLRKVKAAEVDFAKKTAVVRFDPENPIQPESIIEAVKSAGFRATISGQPPQLAHRLDR